MSDHMYQCITDQAGYSNRFGMHPALDHLA